MKPSTFDELFQHEQDVVDITMELAADTVATGHVRMPPRSVDNMICFGCGEPLSFRRHPMAHVQGICFPCRARVMRKAHGVTP